MVGSSPPWAATDLAGVGACIAICSSPLSRNRTFNKHLAQGMTVDEAVRVANRGTAEVLPGDLHQPGLTGSRCGSLRSSPR
ncbi:NAD(P)H-dependent glycerol-3-phosphate dehydrogenase [Streptomyces sp. NPDC005385]|uniref:NAD(P)H-dependent glycerol-3-phosphate dehydrogenase n=1 Tax=Streptomyces sp. NPDC005385 TaxID=3157039 RepID=UPI0033BC68BE